MADTKNDVVLVSVVTEGGHQAEKTPQTQTPTLRVASLSREEKTPERAEEESLVARSTADPRVNPSQKF